MNHDLTKIRTDEQLKQLLEKMAGRKCKPEGELHLCSLVESGLTDDEHARFRATLVRKITERADMTSMMNKAEYRAWFSATWQQRVAALAEVKGVTL